MLVAGRVSDIFGYKRCFTFAWLWFALWSLLAGISVYSHSIIFFDLCRGFQGTAVAMLVPCALALLGSIYKAGPRKNLAFALYAAGAPVGFSVGAVFAALLAQLAAWPWMFYVTCIVECMYVVAALAFVPELRREDEKEDWSKRRKFDWQGALSGTSGLVLFNVAWNQAPAVGWQSAQCITLLIIDLAMIVLCFVVEARIEQPLLPVSKVSGDVAIVLLIIGLGWSSFGILLYYGLNFITHLRNDTVLSTAAQTLPVPFSGLAASLLASMLMNRGVPTPHLLALALVFFVVGICIEATMPIHQVYWRQFFWVMLLSPFGMDISFPAGTIILSNLMPREHQGIAASLVATVVYYSQSIGLGIAGTVEVHVRDGNTLKGFRGALYSGIGLSGLGLVIAVIYAVITTYRRSTYGNAGQQEEVELEESSAER